MKLNKDKVIIIISELYVVMPIMIFFVGWLNIYLAIIGCLLLLSLSIRIFRSFDQTLEIDLINRRSIIFWLSVIIIAAIWVYLSGIGSFVFQNADHWARNPIYRDLRNYSWPVFYDLSQESIVVQAICGTGTVAFSYYFCWWLPAALIAKLFSTFKAYEYISGILLYLWALIGVLCVIYLLCRKFKRTTWIVPIILIFFSGLDIIPFYLMNDLGWGILTSHMEWWAGFFQYSSNTTQLFWVFNQSIPIWLIMAILINLRYNESIAGLCSLAFAYSPWATIGIVPIAIYGSFRDRSQMKKVFNLTNITVPLIMLFVFGTFYSASTGSEGGRTGLLFLLDPDNAGNIFYWYMIFCLIEFGIYYLIIFRSQKHEPYFWVSLVELLVIPLIVIIDSNFAMRGSIPALFLAMYFVMNHLIQTNWKKSKEKLLSGLLIVCICVGMVTPFTEIYRTVSFTLSGGYLLQEDVYSFGRIWTMDEQRIRTLRDQFFVYDYEDKFFFKYLAKN